MNPEAIPITELELSVRTTNLLHRNIGGCTLADLRTLVLCEDPSHPVMRALGARGRKEVREVVENIAAIVDAANPHRHADATWEALKRQCCADPVNAKRIVMLSRDDVRAALTE